MKKPLDPAETAQLLEKAIVLFVDVKRGLDVSKSCKSTLLLQKIDILFIFFLLFCILYLYNIYLLHFLCTFVPVVAVGWQLSVDSLKLALNLLGTTEAMRFLDEFLMKMVTILITQRYVTVFPNVFAYGFLS